MSPFKFFLERSVQFVQGKSDLVIHAFKDDQIVLMSNTSGGRSFLVGAFNKNPNSLGTMVEIRPKSEFPAIHKMAKWYGITVKASL